MSENSENYLKLYKQLIACQNNEDSEKVISMCDKLDDLWDKMNSTERAELNAVAVELNKLTEKK